MNRILILRTSLSLFLKQSTILSLLSFWYSSKDFSGCFLKSITMCYLFYDRMVNIINQILSVTQRSTQIYAATYWRVGNEFCSLSIYTKIGCTHNAIFTIFVLTYVSLSVQALCNHNSVHAIHYSKRRFELLPQLIRLPIGL